MKLTQNTILITGGTSGIGYELAGRLIALGNKVIITGVDPGKLSQAKAQLKGVIAYQSDVRSAGDIRLLYQRVKKDWPTLNVLINNAGIMRKIDLLAVEGAPSQTDITEEIRVNFSGVVTMVHYFLPLLTAQPESAIINISSGLAFVPFSIAPIYCATKAAVHSYTQSLRVQLKNTPVKVYEVAPPATKTPLNQPFLAQVGLDKQMDLAKMVNAVITGLQKDHPEIKPGPARALKLISRLAPGFGVKMLARSAKG